MFHASVAIDSCPPSSLTTTPARLRTAILCNYDANIRPVKDHQNTTAVTFRLLLKYFNYDHFTHTLSIDAWLSVFWVDQHLRWKPNDYDGITSIHLKTYEIWVPDLSVYNRKDQSGEAGVIELTTCAVSYKGLVLCVPPVHTEALCVPNLRRYPFDVQNCTVRFGSWVHKGEEVNLTVLKPAVNTDDLMSNGEWELLGATGIRHSGNYACCPNVTYPSVDIAFEIKRHSGAHAASVLLPLFACILLTLTSMWMSPINKDRLTLSFVNFISQALHVQHVSFMVPLNGENVPSILVFSRDSMLLAGVSVIATIFLKYLMESKSLAPVWISETVTFLVSFRTGQALLLSDSSLKGVAEAENKEDGITILPNSERDSSTDVWFMFGKLLDILFFISYVVTYAAMSLNF
ncbi:acetylcholine receptor subunit alpha-like [Cylas formicarius]|uniref:acetylcholine receptor subunit alpha-like n=1 Tax=Cylas formicarius TaxID=197179 RepID=UPI002958C53C|nr:acetylcholine receptor subunit alpha-like [Cylas formicarius]